MIDRYSRPAMTHVFSDETKMGLWLAVEKAALAAIVTEGIAPREAYDEFESVETVDLEAVREREAEIHHELAAFVDVVTAGKGTAAVWVHYGLTSSDVLDTGFALQLQQGGALLLGQLRAAQAAVLRRAYEHRNTLMLGRTHGMPAEVITFGVKLAGWWHQLRRDEQRIVDALDGVAVGKLSGAVGVYSALSPAIEQRVLDALGLGVDPSATQVIQRDRYAALLTALATCASSLDRFAIEVRHLQRSEVAEAAEPFGRGQKGSSAMPHKRNPIVCERISGLARVVRANAQVSLENVALWHERDISHSSAERVVVPDAFLALDYMLDRFTWLVDGLQVNTHRMRENLDGQKGLLASQQVLLALVAGGMKRDDAYRMVQTAAHRVIDGEAPHFGSALRDVEEVQRQLGPRLVEVLDPRYGLQHLDTIYARLPEPELVAADGSNHL